MNSQLHPVFQQALAPFSPNRNQEQTMNAPTELTTEQLAEQLIAAKADENAANKRRVEIEQILIDRLGAKPEGSSTHDLANGLKITLTGKMSYSADMDMLLQLASNLPPNMRPIKTEPKLDETGAKYLRNNEPDVWALIAPAITIKPAKTSVTIKA